jgi:Reverse transcriptase (RNA-dependent DNA polymerase)
MANEFNNFFSNVGKQISETIQPVDKPATDYAQNNANVNQLSFGQLSQQEYISIINGMLPKSSTDINGISTKLIKLLKFELMTSLLHLFNLRSNSGKFPSKLKSSRTIPIFKSGDPLSCDNYRPISLLSALSKILEKFVANKLVDHLEGNNLLYSNQYGFLRNRSTIHNLSQLTNFITKELNEKKYVVGVFLDLRKAFDVVPHSFLLEKLKHLGIDGLEWDWFCSYLKDRKQQVEINGELSIESLIDISVLQGSILGPILFLCFINDLPNATSLFTSMFADDTATAKSGRDLKQLITEVNVEINKMANWFRSNKMAVNVSKTKYIIFRNKGMPVNIDETGPVVYDDNEIGKPLNRNKIKPLDRVHNDNVNTSDRSYKLLGLYLDEYLSFYTHCNTVCTKLAKSNFIINKVKNFVPQHALRTLYFALVHPHLLYCLPLYGCTSAKNINKIVKMQKRSIRVITKSSYTAHTAPLLQQLNILPFKNLISLHTMSINALDLL